MLLPFLNIRPVLKLILAFVLTAGWLQAAPYGPDGMEIKWTQPDGKLLKLRVFGGEFDGRVETLDGCTVVLHPSMKAFE